MIKQTIGDTVYKIEYLLIESNDDTTAPNEFKSCVFTTFEKGIFINCGTVFFELPEQLIKKHLHESSNSFRYYPSFKKIETMGELEKDIQRKIAFQFSKSKIRETEFMSDNNIIYFNKNDKKCSKVLGTLCEITKLHPTVVINTNLLKLTCELNYGNANSEIATSQNVIGHIHEGFKGFGILYDDIIICYKRITKELYTNTIFSINIIENNIQLTMSPNNELTFEGKVNARNIPKALRPLIF